MEQRVIMVEYEPRCRRPIGNSTKMSNVCAFLYVNWSIFCMLQCEHNLCTCTLSGNIWFICICLETGMKILFCFEIELDFYWRHFLLVCWLFLWLSLYNSFRRFIFLLPVHCLYKWSWRISIFILKFSLSFFVYIDYLT